MAQTLEIEAILERVARNDPAAMDELLAAARADVKRCVRHYLDDSFDRLRQFFSSSDVVQDVQFRYWETSDRLHHPPRTAGEFFKLVNMMVHRAIHDLGKKYKQSQKPVTLPNGFDAAAAPEPEPEFEALPDHVLKALTPEEHTLLRHRLAGLSADEIAAELGVDRATAYRRIHALRTRLADLLGDD